MHLPSFLPVSTRELLATARGIATDVLAPNAARTDAEARWPRESFAALAKAGLMGLHVPKRLGGHEEGLVALAVITEAASARR